MSDRSERLHPADEAWLEHALAEVARGEAPPDLSAAIHRASPSRRAAASACVDAAARGPSSARRFAVLVAVLAVAVVLAVAGTRRGGDAAPAHGSAQDPSPEPVAIAVPDAAALAKLLPEVTAWTLVARKNASGALLPDLPEHAAPLGEGAWRGELVAALGGAAGVGPAMPLADAQAELLLHVGRRCLRGRLHFDGDTATFGSAAFTLADGLPATVAAALRREWQVLAARQAPARQKLQVASMRELVAAIGSDRTIELRGGPFVLDAGDEQGELPGNKHAVFVDASPVPHLEVRDVRNLHLRAIGGPVRVLGRSPADVLTFVGCQGVQCDGLVLGHVDELAFACSAPVLGLVECRDVLLRDCELFGCGTEGVVASKCEGVVLERCDVHTCRYGVVVYRDCQRLRFVGTTFRDCGIPQNGFVFADCTDVQFVDCRVTGMDAGGGGEDGRLFEVRMDDPVRFLRGTIRGNRCMRVANSRLLLVREGTDERDNGPDVQLPTKATDGR